MSNCSDYLRNQSMFGLMVVRKCTKCSLKIVDNSILVFFVKKGFAVIHFFFKFWHDVSTSKGYTSIAFICSQMFFTEAVNASICWWQILKKLVRDHRHKKKTEEKKLFREVSTNGMLEIFLEPLIISDDGCV